MYILSLVLKLVYIYVYQGKAEVGSAEEQPARNNPVTDEVFIIGFGIAKPFFV